MNLLTIKDVEQYLQTSEKTVFRLIKYGLLKGFKVGREWRFEQKDVDIYIQKMREYYDTTTNI